MKPLRRHFCSPQRERGVVLLFALIALAVMMIASVALVRSYNASLYNAGNLAFKRDMRNQAERAINTVMATMSASFNTPTLRSQSDASRSYSALILDANEAGIPKLLLNSTSFDTAYPNSKIDVADQKVEIRYVVDRLCNEAGLETVLGDQKCQLVENQQQGGSGSHLNRAEDASAVGSTAQMLIVYRISVRVDGPRKSQAFYQATFTL